jgi:hypothetical protein
MTEPWLTISTCDTCGGEQIKLHKLPIRNQIHHTLPLNPCKCEDIKPVYDEGEKE